MPNAPAYYFLLGLAYRGIGDASNEKQNLTMVTQIAAGSDLAQAAGKLLADM